MGSTSEFRIFRRISRDERDKRIRHGKLLSEIPATTRFHLRRVYWPLDLAHVAIFAQFHVENEVCADESYARMYICYKSAINLLPFLIQEYFINENVKFL